MANKKVSLYRKCKTPEGWKRYPASMSANGKVKPNTVMVSGVEAAFPVGHYELRSFEESKTVWTRVEGNATDALATLKLSQKRAAAVAIAGDAGVQVIIDTERLTIADQAKKFVAAAIARGSNEVGEVYELTMEEFVPGCKKTYVDELDHDDVLRFHKQLRDRGMVARTVANRHSHIRAFLIFVGYDTKTVKGIAGPKPKYEKTLPEIYELDDLKAFFDSLTKEYDHLLFDVLLTTGLREREAMHLEWRDISPSRKTLHVRSKPKYKHKIKDAEERQMPLTDELIARLVIYRECNPNVDLIFGKRGGKEDVPDGHLLRRLKGLAKDAELNCGACSTCIELEECERWFLHKFRATYITTLLRAGMDLRTVMKLSGHSDLASVMRYLRPAEGTEVQNRVNAIQWR